jgi:RNA polymerase sigma-70 factor (ECF subfamily)
VARVDRRDTPEGHSVGPAPVSDAELIRRFLEERREDAFHALYVRHSPAAYGVLHRLTGGRATDAADVLQTAWIRAATKLATFEGTSAFRTWLIGIALNCYRECRRQQADQGHDDEPAREIGTVVETRRTDIDEILQVMPPSWREVIVLHDVEGYTHPEIASALGIEPGTSKSRLSRARQMFRSRWQGSETRTR